MTLIKSISGIRGTIGGKFGDNLTPIDAVNFGCAYGQWILNRNPNKKPTVVIGRDARISGQMIQNFVQNSLISLGINVIDLDLSTTPTVELMVKEYNADGGIIITASHNPTEWNALKLLNHKGEFISGADGAAVQRVGHQKRLFRISCDRPETLRGRQTARREPKAILLAPIECLTCAICHGIQVDRLFHRILAQ